MKPRIRAVSVSYLAVLDDDPHPAALIERPTSARSVNELGLTMK